MTGCSFSSPHPFYEPSTTRNASRLELREKFDGRWVMRFAHHLGIRTLD
jgi:hypothetical protein